MTPKRWEQVKEMFDRVLELSPEARLAFLRTACADDPALLQEVESLLSVHDTGASFMERPAVEALAEQVIGETEKLAVGKRLGHFQIVALLGCGGMGEVYLAEDQHLGRRVALKLLPAAYTLHPMHVR